MKEDYEEEFYISQRRSRLIAFGVMSIGFIAMILISQFLDISITFK